jgi:hypothetical protein
MAKEDTTYRIPVRESYDSIPTPPPPADPPERRSYDSVPTPPPAPPPQESDE